MADGCQISEACIGEQNIDMAVFFFYGCIETVEVFHISDITLNTDCFAAADFLECYVDLFLAAAGDDDMCAFSNKTHGGGEAHTAVAAGDNGDFAFEHLCHGSPHSPKDCCSNISGALVATGPPALWSSEQNVPTWQRRCAKQSLFSRGPWPQAQSRSLGDPASFHRCRCGDGFASLSSTIASPISSLVLK